MTRFYDLDDANATVAELDGILAVLAQQRAELVRLRDEVLAAAPRAGDGAPTAVAHRADVTDRSVVVGSDGRAKAYRPIPEDERMAAIAAGLASYARGDYFEAHEELEPAWMGTDVTAERALLQGIIKVAAAYVHDVRGNPA